MEPVYAKNGIFVYNSDCLELCKIVPNNVCDLIVTSPPYDTIRNYTSESEWNFDFFKKLAKELYRITAEGGVLVWNVNDEKINGSESGTSFRQALYFMDECGFKLNDTMIWNKGGFSAVGALKSQYAPVFEYMFVFVKGKLKTFNPIKDKPNKHAGSKVTGTIRQPDGSTKPMSKVIEIAEFGQRYNIWEIGPQRQKGENKHPAPFPEQISTDHILSWSNENDLVFDPFLGSGTTAISSFKTKRRFFGCDISKEYCEISIKRLSEAK